MFVHLVVVYRVVQGASSLQRAASASTASSTRRTRTRWSRSAQSCVGSSTAVGAARYFNISQLDLCRKLATFAFVRLQRKSTSMSRKRTCVTRATASATAASTSRLRRRAICSRRTFSRCGSLSATTSKLRGSASTSVSSSRGE